MIGCKNIKYRDSIFRFRKSNWRSWKNDINIIMTGSSPAILSKFFAIRSSYVMIIELFPSIKKVPWFWLSKRNKLKRRRKWRESKVLMLMGREYMKLCTIPRRLVITIHTSLNNIIKDPIIPYYFISQNLQKFRTQICKESRKDKSSLLNKKSRIKMWKWQKAMNKKQL